MNAEIQPLGVWVKTPKFPDGTIFSHFMIADLIPEPLA